MESTLANIRQLFNVKAIAYGVKLDALPDNSFGIFAEGSDTTIATTVNAFDKLPENFRMIAKVNGKMYYGINTINKKEIRNIVAAPYVAPVENEWKTTIDQPCADIDMLKLIINLDEETLNTRDGLTWTHRDFVVTIKSDDIQCALDAAGVANSDYLENSILTEMVIKQIALSNSEFYTAEAQKPDGTVVTDFATFNTENAAAAPEAKVKLALVLKGKPQPAPEYKDIDVDYFSPRGVKLYPVFEVNNGDATSITFKETKEIVYEVNAGADFRKAEFDNMNYYTNLNFHPRMCDGLPDPNIRYQFDNFVNYNGLAFEFMTDNVERNSGRKRLFEVILGTSDTAVFTKLKTLFGV